MAIIVGCPKGKHPDYQTWGASSNCMNKKMKKSSCFKEWLFEDELLIAEGLYDSLDTITQKIDLIPEFGKLPNVKKLIIDLIMLNLKKSKDKNAEEEFKEKIKRVPWDIKPHFMNLLRDGDVTKFANSLKDTFQQQHAQQS